MSRDKEKYPDEIQIYLDSPPYHYGEIVRIGGAEKYVHLDEVVKLKNMVTRLRRMIISGKTHFRGTPPLSEVGLEVTDEAWKLVPTDDLL